jgi:hypothetical protein
MRFALHFGIGHNVKLTMRLLRPALAELAPTSGCSEVTGSEQLIRTHQISASFLQLMT